MTAALWAVMSGDDGSGPFIGVVADAAGVEYVGTKNRRFTSDRVEAIAEGAESPPRTPGAWLQTATYSMGRVKLTRPRAAADRAAAKRAAEDAIKVMSTAQSPSRAAKLAAIAESHYVFAMENADAHDEDKAEGRTDYSVWNADWAAGPDAEADFVRDGLASLR